MIYSNVEFIVLLAATLVAYSIAPGRIARHAILLVSSAVFYAWAGYFDTLIFALVVLVSWGATKLAATDPARKDLYLKAGVAILVGHLLLWKYVPWLAGELQSAWPWPHSDHRLQLPLPIGISFFTLQGIAYLIDLKDGKAKYIPLARFALFKSFFPQLVAGPIVRVPQLLPQLEALARPRLDDLVEGLALFSLGFFKKLAIADRVAPAIDQAFATPQEFSRWALIQALLGYSVQIWADFSGYTDMGRGAARMLGFRLPENFRSPYLANGPSDFWKRWHITLSEWIRDYIYIPLGGSRGAPAKVAVTAIATMLISGLWHGANWTFAIWGLYHGALLASERALRGGRIESAFATALPGRLGEGARIALMFGLTVLGWAIFRAESLGHLAAFLSTIARPAEDAAPLAGSRSVVAAVIFMFALQLAGRANLAELVFAHPSSSGRGRWATLAMGSAAGIGVALVLAMALFLRLNRGSAPFVYFQF